MSDLIARQALARMNLNVVAVAAAYGAASIAADLSSMAKTDPTEAQAKFMEQRRVELCAAYGFNEQVQRKPFAFAEGIAIIPVAGTLINRFGGSYGYVTGYNFIRQQTALAEADDDVKGIIYDVNSYGGEAAGCFECAEFIRSAKKPTMAYVDSNAYSAGYALASGAKKIVSTPSGGVGSIGVVAMHVDMSKALEDYGVKVTFIHFGDHKVDGNPFEPLPADVKKSMQAGVDKAGEKFVALVAKHRNLDAKVVKDTEARTYRADDALALGLIDAVVSPEAAASAFLGELSGSNVQLANQQKGDSMSKEDTQPGANQNAGTGGGAAAAQQQQQQPSAADVSKAQADARTAERARVGGIVGCEEAKGREALANHLAMNTEMSVDDAKKALAVAPKESTKGSGGNQFAAAMNGTPNPNVGADAGAAGADGEQTHAQRILATQKAATGAVDVVAKK